MQSYKFYQEKIIKSKYSIRNKSRSFQVLRVRYVIINNLVGKIYRDSRITTLIETHFSINLATITL